MSPLELEIFELEPYITLSCFLIDSLWYTAEALLHLTSINCSGIFQYHRSSLQKSKEHNRPGRMILALYTYIRALYNNLQNTQKSFGRLKSVHSIISSYIWLTVLTVTWLIMVSIPFAICRFVIFDNDNIQYVSTL